MAERERRGHKASKEASKGKDFKPELLAEYDRRDLMKIFHRFHKKKWRKREPKSPSPTVANHVVALDAKKRARYEDALYKAIPHILSKDMVSATPREALSRVAHVSVWKIGKGPDDWEVKEAYRPGKAPKMTA